jgi:hypothetical protein
MKYALICFNCGKQHIIEINCKPENSKDLIEICNKNGLYGVRDENRSRGIVFCNEFCSRQAKKKSGNYPIKPKYKK